MMRKLLDCTLLLFLVGSGHLVAQSDPVSVTVNVSRNTITVGDHFQLTIEAIYSRDTVVQMPGPDIQLGEFELLDHQYTPLSGNPQENLVARSTYTLTTFSTGELEIPSITLRYRITTSAEEETITTEPVLITVDSVLDATADDIKDIKPPLEIPRDWLTLFLAFTAGVVVMTVALLLWRKRRKAARVASRDGTPDLPPHITAYRALNRLSNSGLLDRGEVVRFHVEVSEIIRRYFAGRFGIDALEMTSQELLASLPREISLSLPQDLLRQCDLVKFAKFQPSRSQSDGVLALAYEIVESTKPRFEEISTVDPDKRSSIDKPQVDQAEGS